MEKNISNTHKGILLEIKVVSVSIKVTKGFWFFFPSPLRDSHIPERLCQCFYLTLQLSMAKISPVPGLSAGNWLGEVWSTNQSMARGWDKRLLRALLLCHQLWLCSFTQEGAVCRES